MSLFIRKKSGHGLKSNQIKPVELNSNLATFFNYTFFQNAIPILTLASAHGHAVSVQKINLTAPVNAKFLITTP
jgi:hypothetical protein